MTCIGFFYNLCFRTKVCLLNDLRLGPVGTFCHTFRHWENDYNGLAVLAFGFAAFIFIPGFIARATVLALKSNGHDSPPNCFR